MQEDAIGGFEWRGPDLILLAACARRTSQDSKAARFTYK